jgi:hypothetical protein
MEGSVLSFLKAEWKVSDTGSAHWASSLWNNIHLNVECTVKKIIWTFCQVADQLLQQNNERYFFLLMFNSVVFIDFYESSIC